VASFVCHGARVRIRSTPNPALLRPLLESLAPERRPTAARADADFSIVARGGGYVLLAGRDRLAVADSAAAILDFAESAVHQAIAQAARGRLFVHAGVVAWGGRAIVIPGRTWTGKSTLVAALTRAGAEYYSDEFAVLDRNGLVRPYTKRLSLRRPANLAARPAVEELGGCRGRAPVPVGLVVVTRHQASVRWRPRPISQAQAMMALFANTVLARVRPRFALATLERAVGGCWGLEGSRGDAEEVAPRILKRLKRLAATATGVD
jgi:hypothetical protein